MRKTKKQPRKINQPDLSRYAGDWVALLGNKVIAHGKNLEDIAEYVTRDAKDKTQIEKIPAAIKVPYPDEGPYILI